MRLSIKIAGVYFLASLPFAWQIQSAGRSVPDALLLGLRAPYDVLAQWSQGTPAGLVPLGLFVFILFIGLSAVWAAESARN